MANQAIHPKRNTSTPTGPAGGHQSAGRVNGSWREPSEPADARMRSTYVRPGGDAMSGSGLEVDQGLELIGDLMGIDLSIQTDCGECDMCDADVDMACGKTIGVIRGERAFGLPVGEQRRTHGREIERRMPRLPEIEAGELVEVVAKPSCAPVEDTADLTVEHMHVSVQEIAVIDRTRHAGQVQCSQARFGGIDHAGQTIIGQVRAPLGATEAIRGSKKRRVKMLAPRLMWSLPCAVPLSPTGTGWLSGLERSKDSDERWDDRTELVRCQEFKRRAVDSVRHCHAAVTKGLDGMNLRSTKTRDGQVGYNTILGEVAIISTDPNHQLADTRTFDTVKRKARGPPAFADQAQT